MVSLSFRARGAQAIITPHFFEKKIVHLGVAPLPHLRPVVPVSAPGYTGLHLAAVGEGWVGGVEA